MTYYIYDVNNGAAFPIEDVPNKNQEVRTVKELIEKHKETLDQLDEMVKRMNNYE